jgi:prepilin-type N-terminal cleavage/methylation domain-containing protein
MMRRDGFTLLEVLVAISLTGIIALLVFGTAHAGFDTSERVQRHRDAATTEAIVRQLLVDALRHPLAGGGSFMNDTLFEIDDRVRDDGLPVDAIRFVTRGITPPLGASPAWTVLLAPTDAGLHLRALPSSDDAAQPIDVVVTDIRGMSVHVLDRTLDAEWLAAWPFTGRAPAAVAIRFVRADGEQHGAPLIVHGALEPVR